MDSLQTIFSQLGLDQSIFTQFVIILVAFILSKLLFLDKLKEVIMNREEKTVLRENAANELLAKSKELAAQYKSKISIAQKERFDVTKMEKKNLVEKRKDEIQKFELKMNEDYEKEKLIFENELSKRKEDCFSSADEVANIVLDKFQK